MDRRTSEFYGRVERELYTSVLADVMAVPDEPFKLELELLDSIGPGEVVFKDYGIL